jgi:hypothetical protein
VARAVASARRTQLVSTYGVGALLPSMDESFMVCGIDEWQESAATEVPEPRLARSLQVETFRLPPTGRHRGRDVPVVRFPLWHYCPECRRLASHREFCSWDEHRCHDCARDLTPSRFVACCPSGHIEDFPYFSWAHQGQPGGAGSHRMSLVTRGRTSSLADILISCTCGITPVSMAGSFAPRALDPVARCRGRRPWLPGVPDEECDQKLRTLQRGSSNVWFGMVRSAISIPPWSEGVHRFVQRYWSVFQGLSAELLPAVLATMKGVGTPEVPVDAVVHAVLERRGELDEQVPTDDDLRGDEFEALVRGRPERSPGQQFVAASVDVAAPLDGYVGQVSEVARLREVRALEGFTRVMPPAPGTEEGSRKAPLSVGRPRWLPAVEVLGEGIFLTIDEDALRPWEASAFAAARARLVEEGAALQAPTTGPAPRPVVRPRDLLLHTFAHLMLNELSLDAGYPVASLRERLYVTDEHAGVLLYTASADSAGSLGGLSSQSRADRLTNVFVSAVRRAAWCSADPVCIESRSTGNDALNLAACHACVLLPETSCERMNNHLDRATVVGLPGDPTGGFFHRVLREH